MWARTRRAAPEFQRGLRPFPNCAILPAVRPVLRFVLLAVLLTIQPLALRAKDGGTHLAKNRRPIPQGSATFEGTLDLVGHYAKPGDTRRYQSIQKFYSNGQGSVRLDWITWPEGDSSRVPESFLLAGERVFHRDSPSERWSEYSGMKAEQGRLQATAGFLRHSKSRDPESTVVARAHPRLGDVRDRVVFTYPQPSTVQLAMALHELHHEWTLHARLTSENSLPAPESLFTMPASFDPPPAHAEGSLHGEAILTQVAEGLWSVDMEDIDSRSLVVEFADHLALIEAALSSANGERIVDTLKRKWPSKPVRYFLFSHHHPHYLGGIRTLIAEGATVVTTTGNEAYVRRIATYPFTLEPDRLARNPKPVQVLPFPTRIELTDATNQIVAWNIGKRSQHTDEFVLFWLPRQKVLFEAEQGWVTVNGVLRASRRAATLLDLLREQKWDVQKVVQSWPMKGDRAEVPMNELEELVAKRK